MEGLVPVASAIVVKDGRDLTSTVVEMWLHERPSLTREAYCRTSREFLSFVGKELPAISLQDVQHFQDTLAHLKPSSHATKISIVKSLLTFAAKTGAVPFNVGTMIRAPRVNSRLADRIFEEDGVQRMIALEPNERNALLLHLLYISGCRISEVVGLSRRDLRARENGQGQVTVIGKGDKERTILLKKTVWKRLSNLMDQSDDTFLFQSQKGGHIKRWQARIIVKTAAERAGLTGALTPHAIRHSHISHALDHGAPAHLVKETVGHASLVTTSKYAHARPNQSSGDYLPG